MSALVELSIFPLDKGESLSPYVARAVRIIRDSGLDCRIGPMGTCLEGDWDAIMAVVSRCLADLRADCDRVYVQVRADVRGGPAGRLDGKVAAVLARLDGEDRP